MGQSDADASERGQPRFVVGIDLGTTNSAVGYVDTDAADQAWHVETLLIPQLVAPGQAEALPTLPSFHYEPADGELAASERQLPWATDQADGLVGAFARDHGIQVPGRMIASAKSWLCHPGVDRTAGILPWQGSDDVSRLSPVEVSSRFLSHLVHAWNQHFPDFPLAEQTVVLTIPASFDEVARNLTIQAAQKAGLPRVLLIEEPQAAFYAWIDRHRHDWEQQVQPGQKILVCDVGGGTTDFTLIRVRAGQDGTVVFHRVAVGEHLILGGDNLDLALAHFLERKFQQEGTPQLTPRQWSVLVRVSRQVKEALLSDDAPEEFTVSLPGSGSRLIGGSLQTQVTRQQVTDELVEGFLPITEFTDVPRQNASGFREFGLPYAADSAMTRYLAAFLHMHAETAAENRMLQDDVHAARPDIVLFNGGLFESPVLKQRMLQAISEWFTTGDQSWHPKVLDCERLDLAVAHGAACYGMVSRGVGVRISAGLPRTYYLGVDTAEGHSAICLVPAGTEPGTDLEPPEQTFHLQTGSPVEFPVFYSGTRLTDATGVIVPADREQLTALPPIRTVIRSRTNGAADQDSKATVSVQVNARLTEIGTLDLWCAGVDTKERWKLQFDVRSAVQTDVAAHEAGEAEAEGIVGDDTLASVERLLTSVFGQSGGEKPGGLARRIGREIGMSRADWPTSMLREIWRTLIELEAGRRQSPAHEAAWLNLLGFALRPGFGFALDDWRIETTWDVIRGRLIHTTSEVRNQWWIMWRRIAGGLSGGQQNATASPLLSSIRQTAQQIRTGRGKGGAIALHEKDAAEIWRALGAFEQLPPSVRRELGDIILQLLDRPRMQTVREPMVWALGRLGSRVPFNGNAQSIVNPETAARWLRQLLASRLEDVQSVPLAVMQLARRTGDRMTDLPDDVRDEAARYLKEMGGYRRFIRLIRDGGTTDAETQAALFGDSLPLGLKMH
ncbi:MAG: Hsp70 family protein [Fuerstiella sp.]